MDTTEPSVDPLIGRVLDGRFKVEAVLGAGGMGVVYRARQTTVDRDVALKILPSSASNDPSLVRRFLAETRVTSTLSHPHIVTVYDCGRTDDGLLYMAMELLDGRTLAAALEGEGAFGVRRALKIAVQVCDALAAAHDREIVHRDTKPSNLMLVRVVDETDFVKVLDFGIAKIKQELPTGAHTRTGLVVGTPQYLAFEF